jgi:hypothetical protein
VVNRSTPGVRSLNAQGSLALENLLYLAATVVLVATGVTALIATLSDYYCNFQDGDRFQDGVVINDNIESCRSR